MDLLGDFIGEGGTRKCFVYAGDESLCLKVNKRANNKHMERELFYYNMLHKKGVDYERFIPRLHKVLEVDNSMAFLFDLVRDEDGQISKSLDYYLTHPVSETTTLSLKKALVELKENIQKHRIITMNLVPDNLLFKLNNDGTGRLIIVDDLGSTVLIPLEYYFDYFAVRKIKRKWNKFVGLLNENYGYSFCQRSLCL